MRNRSRDAGSIPIAGDKLTGLLKQAVAEVLQESRDLLYEVMVEAVEDGGLAHAINEAEDGPAADTTEVIAAPERESARYHSR